MTPTLLSLYSTDKLSLSILILFFFFFFLPSLSLTFRPLSPLAGLPHPSHSISLYLPPLFPHSRVSSAPSLLPDHLR